MESRLERWMKDVPMEQMLSDFMQRWLEDAEVSYDWISEEKHKNVQKVREFLGRWNVDLVTAHTARNLFFEEEQTAQNMMPVLEKYSEILFSMEPEGEAETKIPIKFIEKEHEGDAKMHFCHVLFCMRKIHKNTLENVSK